MKKMEGYKPFKEGDKVKGKVVFYHSLNECLKSTTYNYQVARVVALGKIEKGIDGQYYADELKIVGELSPTDVLKLSMLEGNTGTFNTGSFRKR